MDTNAVIDYLGNYLPANGSLFMDSLPPVISVITRIELLGWYNATPLQLSKLKRFTDNATQFNLDEPVINATIQLRQIYKIKIPDAIIAATALIHHLTLISRNTKDFENINGLEVINLHSL